MIAGVNTFESREAWVSVVGRSIVNEYDTNNNITKSIYYDNNNVVFIKLYSYDTNGNIIKIECVNSLD